MGGLPRRGLWRHRDYTLLWSGELLSELGSQASAVAYPLLVLALTGSAARAGVVGLAKWLPLAVFALPAGALADRLDRKRLMIAAAAVRMLGAGWIVAGLWLGRLTYPEVAVIAFIDSALFIVSYICERGALPHVVPPEQIQDAVARNEARTFAAGIAGPPLGGALFGVARALPFLADAASFVASMGAIALTHARFQDVRVQPVSLRAGLTGGWRWLRRQPFFLSAAALFAAGNPVYTGLYLLAVLLARHAGASPAAIGVMFAIGGAGGLAGAACAAAVRRRLAARTVVVAGQWSLLASVLLLLVARQALLIGLLLALAEFAAPVSNSVVAGARVAATPDELQGRVGAVSAAIAMSLAWAGPLTVGLAAGGLGDRAATLLVAGWTLLLALAATLAPGLRRGIARPGGGRELIQD